MTATTLRMDYELTRVRTRWTMSFSMVVHSLLLLWLVLFRVTQPDVTPITEITLLEPGDPAAAPSAPAAPAQLGRQTPGLAARSLADVHFRRTTTPSEIEPSPQESWAFEDRLDARLAAMQQNATHAISGITPSKVPTSLFGTAPAVVAGGTGLGTPVALNRGGSGNAPLPLARGGGSGTAPALATVSGTGKSPENPAPARAGEGTARRTVAGASISGPIANRPILSYSVPVYPEWAKHDAVEGAVTLYFIVRPDGGVKENILVQRTAGFEDFDESARTALRAWQFKPLTAGQTGEQWGMITFHFRLRDAG